MTSPADTGLSDDDEAPDLETLPDWARKAFLRTQAATSEEAPVTKTPVDFVGGPAWPTLMRAALVSSFLPRQLVGDDSTAGMTLKDVDAAILGFSERTTGPKGTRWTLTPDARRSVLAAASPSDISEAIAWTSSKPGYFRDDPVSKALCAQVSGQASLERRTLPELEALRLAATWLGDVRHQQAPRLEEVEQQVASHRLLAPIYHMMGIKEPDGTPVDLGKVPFFGRDRERDTLYEYVSVVPTTGAISSFLSSLRRKVLGPEPPIVVYGGGGVGKTTLIARFVLEHAQHAQSRFPFVYLDFDRASISAKRPALLLAEMCGQVRAQFPALLAQLTELQEEARTLSVTLEESAEAARIELATLDKVGVLLDRFRDIVDSHTAALERTLEFKRPFLLILDTFEVVQHAQLSFDCIERFIRKLSPSKDDDGRGWVRLRLIVSGRKRPEKFLKGFKEVKLASLDDASATQMLQRLVQDAGRKLDERTARDLLAVVRKLDEKNEAALSPLRIRLIGEIFADETETDGNAIARRLIDELHDTSRTGVVHRKLIEGVLVRRILGHLADKRVKALSDPGLVVRRITPDVIREVMARGTPKPGTEPDDLKPEDPRTDSPDFEPWVLSDEEAKDIFKAFGEEPRLVEQDGNDLRHRQDVREDMLPLIRARRPTRFKNLHRLAFKFFDARVDRDPTDHAARAEAIYHGLWLGMSLEIIDRLWPDSPDFDPRLELGEFEEFPAASSYIRARSGEPLDRAAVAVLPRRLATQWVVAHKESWLDHPDANATVDLVRLATGPAFEGLDRYESTAAVVGRLLYRAGEWQDSMRLAQRHLAKDGLGVLWDMARGRLPTLENYVRIGDLLSLLRTFSNITARLGADSRPLELAMAISGRDDLTLDAIVRVELYAYAMLGMRMANPDPAARDRRLGARLRQLALDVPPTLWRQNERRLRLAILCAEGDIGELVARYMQYSGASAPDDQVLVEAGYALALALDRTGEPGMAEEAIGMSVSLASAPDLAPRLRRMWLDHRDRVMEVVRKNDELQDKMRRVVLFDHHDWGLPLGYALNRTLADKASMVLLAELHRRGFASTSRDSLDGQAIVHGALARGRLLSLVDTIIAVSREIEDPMRDLVFPASAPGIAMALRRWHDTNLQAMNDSNKGRRP